MEPLKFNQYPEICSYDNLYKAFEKARKRKNLKKYVIEFEEDLENNLQKLQVELLNQTYNPLPLKMFILKDPKTRKISKSVFRDRVVHHAICNIIEPMFEKKFIYDSYANRIGKGTINAIKRFDKFKYKVYFNNRRICYVFKADIKQYFEQVNHKILIFLIKKEIKDEKILFLIRKILLNYKTTQFGQGMPLGNLTSQFFANIYLHELDIFVKHKLRAKYYIRYVDDFVILHHEKEILQEYRTKIEYFLQENLKLTLHPQKSKVLKLDKGIPFLGFRIFYYHKLLLTKNLGKFERKLEGIEYLFKQDLIYREKAIEVFEGWLAFSRQANTYKLRKRITLEFNKKFPVENSIKTNSVSKQEKFHKRIEKGNIQFSKLKTLLLLKQGLSIKQIALKRQLKEGTIWSHTRDLIEKRQINVYQILPKDVVNKIREYIYTSDESLKIIYNRLNRKYSYNEIVCVQGHLISLNSKMRIWPFFLWYQKKHCYRKCYANKKQRQTCKMKMKIFASKNPELEMTKKEFLNLFNNHIQICILPNKEKREYISWERFRTDIISILQVK